MLTSLAARSAVVVFISQALGAGLALLVHVLLARWGGPYVYGIYSYATAWVLTLSIGVGVGFPTAALRFIPTYEASKRWSHLRGIVQRGEHVVILAALTVASIGTALLWLFGDFSSSATSRAVLIGLWSLPVIGLVRFHTQTCRALHHIVAAYLVPRLFRPMALVGGFALLTVLPDQWLTGNAVMVVFAFSFLPIALFQRGVVQRHLSTTVAPASAQYNTIYWLRVALPLLLVAGVVKVLQQTDLLLVGWMLDVKAVGQYRAAMTVAAPVGFVLLAVNAVAAPHFARCYAEGSVRRLHRFLRRIAHWLFWPTLALAAVVALGSQILLGLFGPSFVEARTPLLILTLSHVVNAGAGSVGYLLNMTGYHADAARVYGIAAVLNIVGNSVGIYFFGLVGAALASTLSMVLWNVWLHHLVQQRLHVAPSIFHALFLTRS